MKKEKSKILKPWLKIFCGQLFATVLFFLFLELSIFVLDFFWAPKILQNYTINRDQVFSKYLSHIEPFYKNRFCDFIHHKRPGHVLFAYCVAVQLRKTYASQSLFVALGGSTTEGTDCEAGTRWTDELAKALNVKIINLAEGGENSDYSLNMLQKKLIDGVRPDIVLEGDWINEIFEQRSSPAPMKLFFYRSYYTLYKHFRSFRFFANLSFKDFSATEMRNFLLHQGASMDDVANEKRFRLGAVGKSEAFNSALQKYEKNMAKLVQLSKTYGFQVILINFPYVKNYYQAFSPQLNLFLEEWIALIKRQQLLAAEKHRFSYVDVEKCFLEDAIGTRHQSF